ncbi:NAD-dependent epimerase/dehydratase family protein [Spirochaetia bacterium]|nr:NAD-dependent epimerase/dehydratase family protein [Spirochaetia bacterium]
MKRILVTGGTSFVGKNILSALSDYYDITAPNRVELDNLDKCAIDDFLEKNKFDILLHLSTPRPGQNNLDDKEKRFDDMMRAFLNFEFYADRFDKVLYLGSGAEYDKSRDIKMADETDIGKSIPGDDYGFAKYIINAIARNSTNIYNIRLFGCYGPGDAKHKFIYNAIDCCLKNEPVTIRQDCYFDFLYVGDLVEVIRCFIDNKPKYHDYNIVTGKHVLLSEIAKIVAQKMNNPNGIKLLKDGFNNEYTASNQRLFAEFEDFRFTTLDAGIDEQIEWQVKNM